VDTYQIAWAVYIAGALGCGWATWLLFRRFGREWGHFFMISVWAILLTPYAMKVEPMVMAPALFILVMETLINGFQAAKPIAVLLAGVWLVALVLSLIYQLLTRRWAKHEEPVDYQDYDAVVAEGRKTRRQPRDYHDDLSHDEYQARDELLAGEAPMRAER
jgi:fatty acid desaturase